MLMIKAGLTRLYDDRKNIISSRYAFFVRILVFDTKKPTKALEE